MEQEIRIEVEGIPRPQGSKTLYNGRMVESSKGLPVWRKQLQLAAANVMFSEDKLTGALRVEVDFYLPRPKSVKRERPTVPPDCDKLARSLDSLTDAGVWQDDAQVVELIARKHYADDREPGAFIKITQL